MNSVVRARIDERIKSEAQAVLAEVGLTISDAFRLLLIKVAKEKSLPFAPFVPNAETIAALQAADRGEGKSFATVEELFADLNEEC